ncbi:MAG: hypothetical protein A2Z95_05755 [Gallionellales bacterium GWA2_60_18]|nr:MAG: hypothetical protein A2Z95_05755 [Gallionellales bacterium GWA2_60_18]
MGIALLNPSYASLFMSGDAVKNKNDSVFKFNSMSQAALLSGARMVSDALIGVGLQPLPGAELTKADEEACKKLFEVANTFGLEALQVHIDKNPPNARTIAFLLVAAKNQAESSQVSRGASKRARSTRKVDGKNMAFDLWKEWQGNPGRHKDKTAFCNHAIDQISSKKGPPDIDIKTMNVWFDHFRLSETSPEWEAKFGNKYTTEKSEERTPGKTPIAMLLDF